MTNLELADLVEDLWSDDCEAHLLPEASKVIRNLHTENTALRVTEDNLRQELQECQDQRRAAFRRIEELDTMLAQIGQGVPDVGQFINLLVSAAFRKGELWERCQGKFWPEAESNEFTKLRDKTTPDAIASLQQAIASTHPAPQAERTALEQYDLEQSPDYRKGWDDGRKKGYEVGVRHGKEQHLFWQASVVQQKPLTDEQDRALCEAYCNAASDEYFNARPQLDSDVNRRIFYAGHRKAWIEWQAAHNIGEKK